jgi:hypothetical protein
MQGMRNQLYLILASLISAPALGSECVSRLNPLDNLAPGIANDCQQLVRAMELAPRKIEQTQFRAQSLHQIRSAPIVVNSGAQAESADDASQSYQIATQELEQARQEISEFTAQFNSQIIELRNKLATLRSANTSNNAERQRRDSAAQFLDRKLNQARSVRYSLVAELNRNGITQFAVNQNAVSSVTFGGELFSVNGDWSNDGQGGYYQKAPITDPNPVKQNFDHNAVHAGEPRYDTAAPAAKQAAALNPQETSVPVEDVRLAASEQPIPPPAAANEPEPIQPAPGALPAARTVAPPASPERVYIVDPPIQAQAPGDFLDSRIPTSIPAIRENKPVAEVAGNYIDSPAKIDRENLAADNHTGSQLSFLLPDNLEPGNSSGASKMMAENLIGRLENESTVRNLALAKTEVSTGVTSTPTETTDASATIDSTAAPKTSELIAEPEKPSGENLTATATAAPSAEQIASAPLNTLPQLTAAELGIPDPFAPSSLLEPTAPLAGLQTGLQFEPNDLLLSPEQVRSSLRISNDLLATVIEDAEFSATSITKETVFAKTDK